MTQTHRPNGNFICHICNKLINLERDRCTDEAGKVIHESCYLLQLAPSRNNSSDPHSTEQKGLGHGEASLQRNR
jgi:hypothetical protein